MKNTKYQSKTRKRTRKGYLKTSYGIVNLPKGFILYHVSKDKLCSLPNKSVIFMTLHPSEFYYGDAYLSMIEIQKDISLLFMVKYIHKMRIYSSLDEYIEEKTNLAKINYNKIISWIPFLERENLSGWFSSIENKTAIEFAIVNDTSILKIIDCSPLLYNWKNSTYNKDMKLIPKQWGENYSISSMQMPVEFIINSRFKPQIEEYQRQVSEEDPFGTAFSILLNNAKITYFDAPLQIIKWSKYSQK